MHKTRLTGNYRVYTIYDWAMSLIWQHQVLLQLHRKENRIAVTTITHFDSGMTHQLRWLPASVYSCC